MDAREKLEYADQQFEMVTRNIETADAKAGIVSTLVGGFLAFLAARQAEVTHQATDGMNLIRGLEIAVFGISGVCLVASGLFSFSVIFPRLAVRADDLAFWGSISQFQSSELFVQKLDEASADAISDQRIRQCYDLSRVCRRKYETLRIAMAIGAVGFATGIVSMMVF